MIPLVVAVVAIFLAPTAGAEAPSFQELEESLTCQCGCGLTVHACNHLQCPSAIPLRQEIRAQMATGLGETAILGHFEEKYGEKILSSPTTRGFNLAAWVTPFAALGVGSLFVVWTLLRWRRRALRSAVSSPPVGQPVRDLGAAEHDREVLERELRQFEP